MLLPNQSCQLVCNMRQLALILIIFCHPQNLLIILFYVIYECIKLHRSATKILSDPLLISITCKNCLFTPFISFLCFLIVSVFSIHARASSLNPFFLVPFKDLLEIRIEEISHLFLLLLIYFLILSMSSKILLKDSSLKELCLVAVFFSLLKQYCSTHPNAFFMLRSSLMVIS